MWDSLDLSLNKACRNLNFYGDLVYKFKNIVGRNDFSDQFIRYRRTGYNIKGKGNPEGKCH